MKRPMLSPRTRKVLNDLWLYKGRTLLVVLSVAVGVFAVGTTLISQQQLNHGMTVGWQSTAPAHAEIGVLDGDFELAEIALQVPGVATAEGVRIFEVRVQVGEDEYKTVSLRSRPDIAAAELNLVKSYEGAWPAPKNELLLDRSTMRWLGLQVGDTLRVESPTGVKRLIRIAGSAHDFAVAPPSIFGQGTGFIGMETLPFLGEPEKISMVSLRVAENDMDEAHIRAVAADVMQALAEQGAIVTWLSVPKPGQHPVAELINAMGQILMVLGFIALALSGFLVMNVTTALLAQQARQIGIMKTLGATRPQIIGLYLAGILTYGLLALIVGIPGGVAGAYAFSSYIGGLLNFDVRFSLPLDVVLVQIGVGLLIPLAAAAFPVIGAMRVSVREAIHDSQSGPGHSHGMMNWLVRLIPGSRPFQLSLRNTFRRKGRLVLTMGTMVLGGAVVMSVLTARASMLTTLENAMAYFNYDLHGYVETPLPEHAVREAALSVEGVTRVETWGWYSGFRVDNGSLSEKPLQVATPTLGSSMINPTIVEGRWLQANDGNSAVINTDLLRSEPDLQVGGDLTVRVMGKDVTFTIVGVVTGQLAGGMVFTNSAYLSPTIGTEGLTTFVVVQTADSEPAFQQRVGVRIEESFRQNGLRIGQTQTTTNMKESVQQQFDILIVFFLIMGGMLAVVGALGLAGTMSLNVLERTREIGVMRAIGASNSGVLGVFLVEGLVIGLISWVFALALSIPLGHFLSDFVGTQFTGAPLAYTYSLDGALTWLAGSLLLAAISSYVPARRASRVSVRQSLAYEG